MAGAGDELTTAAAPGAPVWGAWGAGRASAMVRGVRSIVVSSGDAGYGFLVDEEGQLRQAGFGPEIGTHMERLSARVPARFYPLAYPAYDEEILRAPSLRVTHGDGTTTTRLRVEDVVADGPGTEIVLVDPDCPLEVRLCFRAEDHGVLRQWVTVTNRQRRPVTLFEVAAASPLLATPSPHLTHFGGSDWAAEWTTTTEPLTPGTKLVDSRGGVRPHLQSSPFFLLSPDGAMEETSGTVVAGALAWGGNTRFAFERTTAPTVRAWCGHNPMAAEYVLDPGATFTTPEQIWAWSSEGVGPLSRRLHRWVRAHAVRDGDDAAPDRGQQLGGHLLRLRHRAAARPHRPDGGPRGRALPARRRLVRHGAPAQRRHGRPGRLAGERGEAAGGPRSGHCASRQSGGSASGCGWSPRW